MKKLNYEQKIAVLRILMDIAMADYRIDEREQQFFDWNCQELDLGESARVDMEKKNSLLALMDVKNFSREQKENFAGLMGKMIVVDEDIHINEVRMYNVVRNFCNIEQEFDENEYPF